MTMKQALWEGPPPQTPTAPWATGAVQAALLTATVVMALVLTVPVLVLVLVLVPVLAVVVVAVAAMVAVAVAVAVVVGAVGVGPTAWVLASVPTPPWLSPL